MNDCVVRCLLYCEIGRTTSILDGSSILVLDYMLGNNQSFIKNCLKCAFVITV